MSRLVPPSLLYPDVGRNLGFVRISHVSLAVFRLQPGGITRLFLNFTPLTLSVIDALD